MWQPPRIGSCERDEQIHRWWCVEHAATLQKNGVAQIDSQLTDRADQHDLASQYPERVQQMAQLWFAWRDQFFRDARKTAE